MGGMALGAWLVSARGGRWTGLIRTYAIVELIIGVTALVFHPMFVGYMSLSQETVLPALEGEATIRLWQWGTAALMIAPQSIMLGMTFPLMSGGYLRVAPGQDGQILGGLYFTNSIGAAVGALVATFLLLPWIGMPGAIIVAGVINVLVGLLAWRISLRAEVTGSMPGVSPSIMVSEKPAAENDPGSLGRLSMLMLFGAGITGASSFVYEIGWIRMLNQALGTTVHSFELMLSAFILGLAFGGLWIRKRSARIVDPVNAAGLAQVLMGLAALISLPLFANSFAWVGWLMEHLPKSDAGYSLYGVGSATIALLIMFPAAFFAGMTLPLFTMILLRRGAGERSIGRIYAANTLGAIVGVMLAVHVLIPMVGLRLAVTFAALADILLGLVLLRGFAAEFRPRWYFGALAATLLITAGSLLLGNVDPRALASGVFRHGYAELDSAVRVRYLRDGKTATVSYYEDAHGLGIIATNGKPDASIQLRPEGVPTDDEYTMVMAATLPLALHPDPKRIAIIGWGSGLSTHTILGSAHPEVVDTIEIEPAMVQGARLYGDHVSRGYSDPRSNLRLDDARTFFSSGGKRYDVIVSEPSNPWVSGVSSLFTREFYGFLSAHLDDDGVLVQWMQTYELNDPLFYSMVAALIGEYPHVQAYLTNSADVIFIASHKPIRSFDAGRLRDPALVPGLERLGLTKAEEHGVRRFADRSVLAALVELYSAPVHTDYLPSVALNAPRSRFKGESVQSIRTLMAAGMPVLELTGGRTPVPVAAAIRAPLGSLGATDHANAGRIRELMLGEGEGAGLDPAIRAKVDLLLAPTTPVGQWLDAATVVADFTIGYLPPEDLRGVWTSPAWVGSRASDPQVSALLAAYAAVSDRDGAAMHAAGLAGLKVLQAGNSPLLARDHLLVIAMLGALQQKRFDDARAVETTHGASVRVSNAYYGMARGYLSAWLATKGARPEAPAGK
ncbi:MAG: spermine synthase [Xanthomonadaceae bacterium]|nr:spermine synthase [Xanthomonadaceae bacterium]